MSDQKLVVLTDGTLSQAVAIRATFRGGSEVQRYSKRGLTLEAIRAAPQSTITLADLQRRLGFDPRGYVDKLRYHDHVELLGHPRADSPTPTGVPQ